MEIISSRENKKIKFVRNLLEKGSFRKKNNCFVAEGIKLVLEALEFGNVTLVMCAESLFDEISERLETELFQRKGAEFVVVSDSIFKSVSETIAPQGILAVAEMPCYNLTDREFLEEAYKKDGKISLLVLEDTSDPGNLGTIIRTAEAAGMTGVLMGKGTVDIFNPKTVRSTMGSVFRLPFSYTSDLPSAIKELKGLGIKFYATHLKGEKSYKKIEYQDKSAIIIGNEARGLSEKISDLADIYVKIPMKGNVESLNAAVAAALMMYEM